MTHLVFLPINRSVIGDWRAAQLFCACRSYAHLISPGCEILVKYEDYERVGWRFWLRTPEEAEKLLAFHNKIMSS